MKTAISVPDAVYRRAEDRARALGMNRSEFYTRAAERFLDVLDQDDVTARMNAAVDAAGDSGRSEQRAWADLAASHLASEEDW